MMAITGVTVWLLVAVRLGLGSPEAHSFPTKAECMKAAEKRIAGMLKAGGEVVEPFAYFCIEGLSIK
jgi:hypothetical protein